MSLQLRNLFHLHRLMDEATDGATGGGGGGGEGSDDTGLNVDIAAAADAIGADLGLNKGEGTDDLLDGSATPPEGEKKVAPADETAEAKAAREAREASAAANTPAAKAKAAAEAAAKLTAAKKTLTDRKVDFTGKTDAEVLKLAEAAGVPAKVMPKAWQKAMDKVWSGLPPEAKAYIEQREAEVEAGFKQYGDTARYGQGMQKVMEPYAALLTSQGVKDHTQAVTAVMNAHYILSTDTPERKAQFMVGLAKNYGVDLAMITAAAAANPGAQETANERALRERLDRSENAQKAERQAAFNSLKEKSAAEVDAFASDPKHVYFKDVAGEIALLLQDPNLSLEQAYERAIYANPVTRAKELARLADEATAKARAEAEAKAKAAEKAKGTVVRGKEEHRASPDLLGSMEDTLRDTFRTIKDRQETS